MNKIKAPGDRTLLCRLAALKDMETDELRALWLELYDRKAPDCPRQYLQRQLAFRIQEKHYNRSVSNAVEEKIQEVADKPKKKPNAAGVIPGTRFERTWQGRQVSAIARANGIEVDGQLFASLSAAAKYVTGTVWNGKVFWGLK